MVRKKMESVIETDAVVDHIINFLPLIQKMRIRDLNSSMRWSVDSWLRRYHRWFDYERLSSSYQSCHKNQGMDDEKLLEFLKILSKLSVIRLQRTTPVELWKQIVPLFQSATEAHLTIDRQEKLTIFKEALSEHKLSNITKLRLNVNLIIMKNQSLMSLLNDIEKECPKLEYLGFGQLDCKEITTFISFLDDIENQFPSLKTKVRSIVVSLYQECWPLKKLLDTFQNLERLELKLLPFGYLDELEEAITLSSCTSIRDIVLDGYFGYSESLWLTIFRRWPLLR